MILGVYFVIALLVATKLCDVASTLNRISYIKEETNPIARQIMIHIGRKKAVWIVFLLSLLIIGLAGYTAIKSGRFIQIIFIIVGVSVSIVQGFVAYCNWTGRENFITMRVRFLHLSILKITRR
jgi:hypothetical protein